MNKRIEWIDIYKGFGIVLMIMGHVGFGTSFNHWIHSFHVPMFFFISGYLFKKKKFSVYLLTKAKSLIIPGLFYCLIMGIYTLFIKKESISLISLLWPNLDGNYIWVTTWFLVALFFSCILYFWIDEIRNLFLKIIVVIILSIFGQIEIKISNGFALPLCLGPAFVGVGLMYLGYISRKFEDIITNFKLWQLVLMWIISIILSNYNGYINMRSEVYPNIIMFWVVAYINIIALINTSKIITKSNALVKTKDYFRFIGENSLTYLVFNGAVIGTLNKICELLNVEVGGIVFKLFIFFLTIAVLHIMCIVFNKTRLKFLLGKF